VQHSPRGTLGELWGERDAVGGHKPDTTGLAMGRVANGDGGAAMMKVKVEGSTAGAGPLQW
jgi:hypothetical protein